MSFEFEKQYFNYKNAFRFIYAKSFYVVIKPLIEWRAIGQEEKSIKYLR